MSRSVSQGKGVTVFTINSNAKSKRPTVCQFLGNLCYSSARLMLQGVKRKIYQHPIRVLGIVQIYILGIIHIITGISLESHRIYKDTLMCNAPYWLGSGFIISGIMTILADKYPRNCLFALAVILNTVSGILSMIAVGLYSWDFYKVYDYSSAINPEQWKQTNSFLYIEDSNVTNREILDVVMIVFAVLQLCLNITSIFMSLRTCFRKDSVDAPRSHKLLPEVMTGNPE
ncbi:membrane-spanning 4-domains subfamily A member 8-like isoform X1 [Triplophysa rosa]|uniref:Membrane-spanning 4-domains subfamily A member 8A n=1 Tax=Triplophysa rosa TaxID=992332 RepID=A0A9W8CBR7_TRIRA|nr:membrane-spanning 4-domains subfamily A member 8-like isoform X1 [Triplophysa rosa]KAI7813957.1 Membrane-spanning 4-domains subfamily A member 8A [Triplophysa rosa]